MKPLRGVLRLAPGRAAAPNACPEATIVSNDIPSAPMLSGQRTPGLPQSPSPERRFDVGQHRVEYAVAKRGSFVHRRSSSASFTMRSSETRASPAARRTPRALFAADRRAHQGQCGHGRVAQDRSCCAFFARATRGARRPPSSADFFAMTTRAPCVSSSGLYGVTSIGKQDGFLCGERSAQRSIR